MAPVPVAADCGAGAGVAQGHHGEILQGALNDGGRVTRVLVTLPCPLFRSTARAELTAGVPLRIVPEWKRKALRAAELTLAHVGRPELGGRIAVDSEIPLCCGFGSSTADVVATIYAVLDAAGTRLPSRRVAHLAVRAETASDPVMFRRPVLFAQRRGQVIEQFGPPLCRLAVVGFRTRPQGVDTLALVPARYGASELAAFQALRDRLREALRAGNAAAVAAVATASARINERHHPIGWLSRIEAVGSSAGGCGVQIAHSGSVAGILFDAALPDLPARIAAAEAALARAGFGPTWNFQTGDDAH